ncbi:glycosyltransferase [Longibacter salinarum]|uniref:Glycosyltransferase n=1 Tax=Longibacter salinarum TaxID=1850348 RepID=A0A2A8D3C4_9BACT|nr:glycosyltransferase [Longibacter salinarum]PEN15317.1 glycosyltransferase [Longibacter salinarum]
MSSLRILAWPAFDNKTGNPYNRLLYSAMEGEEGVTVDEFTPKRAVSGAYDIIHVHWPDDFLSLDDWWRSASYVMGEIATLALARMRGTRVVWTGHDLGPHESHHAGLENMFWSVFPSLVDGFISLSQDGLEMARREIGALSDVPSAIVPHGHYRDAYPDPHDRDDARANLGLHRDAPVLLYVGRIRPYKNVPHLVRIFRQWCEGDARLLVVGEPSTDTLRESIQMAAQRDSRIRLDLRYVPEDLMPRYLAASDLVVLPYDHILHSGSALLALSFNRPVLVPNRGAMGELRDNVGPEWVHTYDGTLTPKRLREALDWVLRTERPERAPLDKLEWPVLARQTIDLYREVLAR